MWTALFAIVIATSAGCALAAVWLTPRCGNVRHRKDPTRLPDVATRRLRGPALLSRRMQFLHIDRERLARSEPLLFRRLAMRCGECELAERCAHDLDRVSAGSIDQDWKDYCLNASLLGMLSAIEGIGNTFAAQDTGPISLLGEGGTRGQ